MIKHFSMAKYKPFAEGRSKEENIQLCKALAEGLKEHIPNINHIEVGINSLNGPNDFDVVTYSEYDSMDDFMATVKHPVHDDFVAVLKKVTEINHAVTFEV